MRVYILTGLCVLRSMSMAPHTRREGIRKKKCSKNNDRETERRNVLLGQGERKKHDSDRLRSRKKNFEENTIAFVFISLKQDYPV